MRESLVSLGKSAWKVHGDQTRAGSLGRLPTREKTGVQVDVKGSYLGVNPCIRRAKRYQVIQPGGPVAPTLDAGTCNDWEPLTETALWTARRRISVGRVDPTSEHRIWREG